MEKSCHRIPPFSSSVSLCLCGCFKMLLLVYFDRRLAEDGEVDRVGDEAELVRLLVELRGQLRVSARGEPDGGPQCDLSEMPAAVVRLGQRPFRVVSVVCDDKPRVRAEVQEPEHV